MMDRLERESQSRFRYLCHSDSIPQKPACRAGFGLRHVKVTVNGEVVAETERSKILFETGLPPRYYIHPEDVREDVFIKSETTTR